MMCKLLRTNRKFNYGCAKLNKNSSIFFKVILNTIEIPLIYMLKTSSYSNLETGLKLVLFRYKMVQSIFCLKSGPQRCGFWTNLLLDVRF